MSDKLRELVKDLVVALEDSCSTPVRKGYAKLFERARAALAEKPLSDKLFNAALQAHHNLFTSMNLAEHPKSCECYGCNLGREVFAEALKRGWQNTKVIRELERRYEQPPCAICGRAGTHENWCNAASAQFAEKPAERPQLSAEQVRGIHEIIEKYSTDVVDYELATDDINAIVFSTVSKSGKLMQALKAALPHLEYLQRFSGGTIMTHLMEEKLGRAIEQCHAALLTGEAEKVPPRLDMAAGQAMVEGFHKGIAGVGDLCCDSTCWCGGMPPAAPPVLQADAPMYTKALSELTKFPDRPKGHDAWWAQVMADFAREASRVAFEKAAQELQGLAYKLPHEQSEDPADGMIPTEGCAHCQILLTAIPALRALADSPVSGDAAPTLDANLQRHLDAAKRRAKLMAEENVE